MARTGNGSPSAEAVETKAKKDKKSSLIIPKTARSAIKKATKASMKVAPPKAEEEVSLVRKVLGPRTNKKKKKAAKSRITKTTTSGCRIGLCPAHVSIIKAICKIAEGLESTIKDLESLKTDATSISTDVRIATLRRTVTSLPARIRKANKAFEDSKNGVGDHQEFFHYIRLKKFKWQLLDNLCRIEICLDFVSKLIVTLHRQAPTATQKIKEFEFNFTRKDGFVLINK